MELTRLIIIRYDELVLKTKIVRTKFIKQLKNNIFLSLKKFENLKYKIHYDHIEISNFNIQDWIFIKEKLIKVFGISNFSLVHKFPKDFNLIKENIFELISQESKEAKNFKLFVKRVDKSFFLHSRTIIETLAEIILKNSTLKVNVISPDLKIYLDILENGIYLYTNKIEGAKGLPVGCSGKVLLLISGGIDSPVAAWKLMKRGLEVVFLHFTTPPITSLEALNKVKKLVEILKPYNAENASLYTCNFLVLQNELMHISLPSYRVTLMRRMFLKIANQLAQKLNINAVGTGESVGQVASQTLESIYVINEISNIPILRPLIADDKLEIINLATKINTYKTSILPFEDCCSLFVPKKPIIKPKLAAAKKLEKELYKIFNLDELIDQTTNSITNLVVS